MTPEAHLDRARALLPSLRKRTAYTAQLRRLPGETFKDFQEDPFVQFRLAEAAAEINEARDRLLRGFADMMQLARTGQEIPLAHRSKYSRPSK